MAQLHMFPTGDDLPLFSGTAQRARPDLFRPQPAEYQDRLELGDSEMKTANEIVTRIVENGLASTNEELEVQFEYFAGEDGWNDDEIKAALDSPWFPWFKQDLFK